MYGIHFIFLALTFLIPKKKWLIVGVFLLSLLLLRIPEPVVYSIDDGPGPVARDAVDNYEGKLSLFPVTATGQTFVEWTSSYESSDDAAVGELCNPVYYGLLQAMKSALE